MDLAQLFLIFREPFHVLLRWNQCCGMVWHV
jgi:hypothetical protein